MSRLQWWMKHEVAEMIHYVKLLSQSLICCCARCRLKRHSFMIYSSKQACKCKSRAVAVDALSSILVFLLLECRDDARLRCAVPKKKTSSCNLKCQALAALDRVHKGPADRY